MSMSQLKTPDEELDEICSRVRWYHLPLIVLALLAGLVLGACVSLASRKARKMTRKGIDKIRTRW